MIFNIFLFLFAISIILMICSFALDIPLFGIIGAILMLGLGGVVTANDVQIQVGENATNTLDQNGTIVSTSTTDIYESYDWGGISGTAYGIFFLILAVGMFVMALMSLGD